MKEKIFPLLKKSIAVFSVFAFLLFLVLVGGEKVSLSSLRELFTVHATYADTPPGGPGPGDCCGCDCGVGGW